MASAKAKIRHVFGDTFSCRAAPPDILVELSGVNALSSIISTDYIWREHRAAIFEAILMVAICKIGSRLVPGYR